MYCDSAVATVLHTALYNVKIQLQAYRTSVYCDSAVATVLHTALYNDR